MNLLFLTFLFPLIGFLLLAFARGRLSENVSALIGVGSMALSAASAAWVGYDFLRTVPAGGAEDEREHRRHARQMQRLRILLLSAAHTEYPNRAIAGARIGITGASCSR